MAKIAHKIPKKCAIFHIIIFSDITTEHMMHEPSKAFQIMGGIRPGGMCPRGYMSGGGGEMSSFFLSCHP